MNTWILAPVLFAFLFGPGGAFAAAGEVTIFSPADDAMFGSSDRTVLKYNAVPGPSGVKKYIDVTVK
jgi:hypothetical protein